MRSKEWERWEEGGMDGRGGEGRREGRGGEATGSSLLPFVILLFNSRPAWYRKTNFCNLATRLLHMK